jgi:hypothetical protein
MSGPSRPPVVEPAQAARVADFARACKAAARAVSLYPPTHPAIRQSLARLVDAAARATAHGALRLRVEPRALVVDGAHFDRPDAAVVELAQLLHAHAVGQLVLHAGTDAESWRVLLQLLARAPEEVRAGGGIGRLWATAGGSSIEVEEIDYAEVLRERVGGTVGLDEIVAACLKGRPLAEWDEAARAALAAVLAEPERLAALVARLVEEAGAASPALVGTVFLALLCRVAEHLASTAPDRIDPVFRQLAQAAGRLPAEALAQLLAERHTERAVAGGLDVVAAVVERMAEPTIVEFVAGSVIAERGATARLAEAFQALVPEIDRQRRLLSLAADRVAQSPLAQETNFEELWSRVEEMLTSYSDRPFVSAEYGRELTSARAHALEVEQTSDDPPERIAAWLQTVSDAALRELDVRLLLDLLAIEPDAARWRDLAETVAGHVEDLTRAGLTEVAWQLADRLADEATAGADPVRREHATRALEGLAGGPFVRHAARLRGADAARLAQVRRVCHAIGPKAIPVLAEALAAEQDPAARQRLRDVLVGYGPRGREAVQQLLEAPNWEVRRTAAYLLREFGGTEGLNELEPLLSDSEPLVQREAIQAVILHGNDAAYAMLLRVLRGAPPRVRESLSRELKTMRDARAAPLFGYLVKHANRRAEAALYESAIETLGTFGGPEAVDTLERALYAGDWWAPRRTRTQRRLAAQALRRIGTPEAIETLRRAAARGSLGVRRAARAELGR